MTVKPEAREKVLHREAAGLGADPGKANFATRRAAALASLTGQKCEPQPVFGSGLVERFKLKARKSGQYGGEGS